MKDKRLALELLNEKRHDILLRYEDISLKTGYSVIQLKRLYKELLEKDMEDLLIHGNTNKKPVNKASTSEIEFLRKLKEPYPNITITQFRDIFLEDILYNPKKQWCVKKYHLKERSLSWFRRLFINEGWKSPAKRKSPRRDGRSLHPLRAPAPKAGELIQIDGTPYDWLNNGEMWTLHLAVDDATSTPLAGWFFPTERQLGYCYIMRLILLKHGIPMALYSDKHNIFHSVRDDKYTQFGLMMNDLGIDLIFANTPEAKGRIERYNGTVQGRLPNDIIRFGIKDYDTLNIWFNEFYIPYIGKKFSFSPIDPNEAFIPMKDLDLSTIFALRFERYIRNDMFSYNNDYYSVINDDNEIVHIINDTKISVRIDVFSNEIYVLRYGKKYSTKLISKRKRSPQEIIDNQKELQEYLNSHKK